MKILLQILLIFSSFQLFAQNWQQLDDFPGVERDDGTGFLIGDTAYFGSGLSPWWSAQGDFYGMNLTTEDWFQIASLPAGKERQYACSFSGLNNSGFVFGGIDGTDFLNDLWKYDPSSNSWTEVSSLPSDGRSGASCFVINDTAYIIGGKTSLNSAINEVWAYQISTDTWTQKSNFPFGNRWRSAAASMNNNGYLIFGTDEANIYHNELYEYNPLNDSWLQISSFPSIGRSHATMFASNAALFTCFGRDSLNNTHNDFWQYNFGTNSWTILPGIPSTGRRGGIAVAYQNKLFYSTGIDAGNVRLNQTWKYDPSLSLVELGLKETKELINIVDLLGRKTEFKPNTILIYIYSDGTTEKVYRVE